MTLLIDLRICEVLLKKSDYKCLNDEDEDSNTALHMAARAGHLGVVELLIKSGADKEARNCDQQTPLDFAAENGYQEIVKHLLDNDVPVDPTDKFEKVTILGWNFPSFYSKLYKLEYMFYVMLGFVLVENAPASCREKWTRSSN